MNAAIEPSLRMASLPPAAGLSDGTGSCAKIGKRRGAWQQARTGAQALPRPLPRGIFQNMPDLEPELLMGLAVLTLLSVVLCAELFRRLVNLTK